MNSVQLFSGLAAIAPPLLLASGAVVGTAVMCRGNAHLYRYITASQEKGVIGRALPLRVGISNIILSSCIVAKIMQVAGLILVVPKVLVGGAVIAAGIIVYTALCSRSRTKPPAQDVNGKANPDGVNTGEKANTGACKFHYTTFDDIHERLFNPEEPFELPVGHSLKIMEIPEERLQAGSPQAILNFMKIPTSLQTKIEGNCITLTNLSESACNLWGPPLTVPLEKLKEKVRQNDFSGYQLVLQPGQELQIIVPVADVQFCNTPHLIRQAFYKIVNCINCPAGIDVSMQKLGTFVLSNNGTEDRIITGIRF